MRVLSAADVERLFHLDLAIESQRAAFTALGRGEAVLPPRLLIPGGGPDGTPESTAFCYAARLSPDGAAVSKFGSVNPANVTLGLPTVSAVITVLSADDGRPVAVLDGTSVTTLRTSAAGAVAASALAIPGARTLAVLGSGVQARGHVRAIARVCPDLDEVRIYSPDAARREALARQLSTLPGGPAARAAESAEEAVREADIVACCTTSASPVLDGAWLVPGALVISVGSFEPDRSEVPPSLVSLADAVVVDDVAATVTDAGPVVAAIASGAVAADGLIPLGAVLTGQAAGRRADTDVIFYNSVGLGVQDAAAALSIVNAAEAEARAEAGPVPDKPALDGTDAWEGIGRLRAHHSEVPAAVQLLKLSEEVGEVASAYIGMTGMNSRKGVYATGEDLLGELADVIITAAAAMTEIAGDAQAAGEHFRAHLAAVLNRAGLTGPGDPE